MFRLSPGDDVGPLERWALDNPASAYVIREGTPETSGRIDFGGPGHVVRYGVWRCTRGQLDCTEQGDELMLILSGRCNLIDHASGNRVALAPGDSYFVRNGSRVTWDIKEDLTKVFFGHKPGGY